MATLRLPESVAAKVAPRLLDLTKPSAKPPKPAAQADAKPHDGNPVKPPGQQVKSPVKPPQGKKAKQPKAAPDKPIKRQRSKAEIAASIAAEHALAMCRRTKRRKFLEAFLAEQYPALFANRSEPKPLALGIDKALRAAHGWSNREVSIVLGRWTIRDNYLRAVAAGGPRYNLDGSEADEGVSDFHAEAAREALALEPA